MKISKRNIEKIKGLKTGYGHEYALELFPSIQKAVGRKGGKIYCSVEGVSRSGMSRTIKVYVMHKGQLVCLNNTAFWQVYGDSRNSNGEVRITGCGMDMLFEATYRLYNFCFDRKRSYVNHLNRYQQL